MRVRELYCFWTWYQRRQPRRALALNEGLGGKVLSDRIGHAHPGITYGIYTHRSNGQDRAMANHMGEIIRAALEAQAPSLTSGG